MRFWNTFASSSAASMAAQPVCNPAAPQELPTLSTDAGKVPVCYSDWLWESGRVALLPSPPARAFDQLRQSARGHAQVGRADWLDAMRGITIAMMLVMNSLGSEDNYALLSHSEWNGFTLADLVFPSFLFILGASLALSLAKHGGDGRLNGLYLRVLRRVVILFTLGILLNGFPNYDFANLRIMGVLQRIALAYALASAIVLSLRRQDIWILCAFLLVGYWLLMAYFPVPGFGAGDLSAAGNLAAYIDGLAFTPKHLLGGGPTDPEGLLTTLPALVNVLSGYLVVDWLRSQPASNAACIRLVGIAAFTLLLGFSWDLYFPVNKQLWTSSYVVYSTGWSLLFLSFCYYAIEIRQWRRWSGPFVVMGTNAIFVYVASEIVDKVLCFGAPDQGGRVWMFREFFSWANPKTGSFLYGIAITGLWCLVLYGMRRRSLFLKV